MTMETAGVSPFDAAAILVALAAAFGYLNYRFLRFPQAIGLTVMGAVASLAVVAADALVPGFAPGQAVRAFLRGIDFETTLMEGMLSFLLFAGALHVNLTAVWSRRWAVLSLATAGVLISTALVGLGFMGLGRLAGLDIPLLWCLVFGALISPTDPV
ncbi:MAG: cation:proton antiporter, partial [Kiloniellaceae bacterium]